MSGGEWEVKVDRACRRSGICAAAAPRYFTVDDQHRTRVTPGPIGPDPDLVDVAEACPAEAITIVDRTTGEPVTERRG